MENNKRIKDGKEQTLVDNIWWNSKEQWEGLIPAINQMRLDERINPTYSQFEKKEINKFTESGKVMQLRGGVLTVLPLEDEDWKKWGYTLVCKENIDNIKKLFLHNEIQSSSIIEGNVPYRLCHLYINNIRVYGRIKINDWVKKSFEFKPSSEKDFVKANYLFKNYTGNINDKLPTIKLNFY